MKYMTSSHMCNIWDKLTLKNWCFTQNPNLCGCQNYLATCGPWITATRAAPCLAQEVLLSVLPTKGEPLSGRQEHVCRHLFHPWLCPQRRPEEPLGSSVWCGVWMRALCWVWQGTRDKVSRAHISVNQHSGGATPKGCEATASICTGSPSFPGRTWPLEWRWCEKQRMWPKLLTPSMHVVWAGEGKPCHSITSEYEINKHVESFQNPHKIKAHLSLCFMYTEISK